MKYELLIQHTHKNMRVQKESEERNCCAGKVGEREKERVRRCWRIRKRLRLQKGV
jgi:hypothetical protein